MNETVEKVHAELSPSGADRWMTCLGSTALCKGLPNERNQYSDEGTDYHTLAAICVDENKKACEFIGRELPLGTIVTEEGAQFLQEGYLDHLPAYVGDGSLAVEQEVGLAWYTGNAEDIGTSDAVGVRTDRELFIGDLKFGQGVEVSPERNRQEMIYGLGVVKANQFEEEYDTVRQVIFQPRTGDGKPKEWVVSMEELLRFGKEVESTAKIIRDAEKSGKELPLKPSEKACRFCKAKATCPALANFVSDATAEGFENIEKTQAGVGGLSMSRAEVLGRGMDKLDLVEIWMKGIQSAVEIELLAGGSVLGIDGPYKLVQGKKGNRKWVSNEEAEELLKDRFRLKNEDMYTMDLKSPTAIEKLLKKEHPRRWDLAAKLVTQSEGSKHVANAKDPRPAISMAKPEEGFGREDVEEFF